MGDICTSCKDDDDDDDNTPSASSLIGTWKSVSIKYEAEGNVETQSSTATDYNLYIITENRWTEEYYFEGEKSGSFSFPYKADGNKIIAGEEYATVSLSGNTLTIVMSEVEGETLTIKCQRQ